MNYTLNNYNQAQMDINLDSIPKRNKNGTYNWSLGQEKIINDSQYNRLREINLELKHLTEAKKHKLNQILTYQAPTDELDRNSNKALNQLNDQLTEIETDLSAIVSERDQLKRDLINRGYMPKETVEDAVKKEEKKKLSKYQTVIKFFKLLIVWLILEAFMTLIQVNSLRDEKGWLEIIIRGMSLGLMIIFFHVIAERNIKFKHPIHIIYQVFTVAMIFITMFLSPVLYHLYPTDFGTADTSALWSISESIIPIESSPTSNLPFFVSFYTKYDWIPAGLSSLFFIVIYFGLHFEEKKEPSEIIIETKETKPKQLVEPTDIKLRYLETETKRFEFDRDRIKREIVDIEAKPIDILPIYQKVTTLQIECREIDKKVSTLEVESEVIISKLMLVLNNYEIEYRNILKNNEIKSSFIKPEWPVKEDIINFFKL
jgi:hypothetical protein